MFHDEGAVAVASTYTQVGGTYERGFRRRPGAAAGSLADYCLSCYTNLPLPQRSQILADMVRGTRPTASSSTRSRAATRSQPASSTCCARSSG
ncbi:MAG: hypothetical protein HS111_02420 [Kofleriaceae bacterium]|nr:hypothetical protein [Kofleriaceae bacterium]